VTYYYKGSRYNLQRPDSVHRCLPLMTIRIVPVALADIHTVLLRRATSQLTNFSTYDPIAQSVEALCYKPEGRGFESR
jgi:hypothetical protein